MMWMAPIRLVDRDNYDKPLDGIEYPLRQTLKVSFGTIASFDT